MDITKIKGKVPENVYNGLNKAFLTRYGINSSLKLAHFLAQCSKESAAFTDTEENLNHSAANLLKYWPNRFTAAEAKVYAGKPEKIANRAYGGRYGNGDEASGDGWKYRGRGYIQITFKANYSSYKDASGHDVLKDPDLVANSLALDSAANFFKKNKLFTLAETGDTLAVVTSITTVVKGDANTSKERHEIFKDFYQLLEQKDELEELQNDMNLLKVMYADTSLKLQKLINNPLDVGLLAVNPDINDFFDGKEIKDICTCGVDYSNDENGGGGNCAHYVANKLLWNITKQDGVRYNCPAGFAIQASDLKDYCNNHPAEWQSKKDAAEMTGQGLIFGVKGKKIKHVGIFHAKDSIYHYGFTRRKVLKNAAAWWKTEYDELYFFQRN